MKIFIARNAKKVSVTKLDFLVNEKHGNLTFSDYISGEETKYRRSIYN